jgi:hypothetical protein
MRRTAIRDVLGRPRDHQRPTARAAFGAEVEDPVGAFDDFEIVLDDDEAVAFIDEALEQFDEQRDVVEVEAGGGFVEEEKAAFAGCLRFQQMTDEFEALRFTAAEGVERLAEAQVAESGINDELQAAIDRRDGAMLDAGEPRHGIVDGHAEHVVDGFAVEQDFERVRLVALPSHSGQVTKRSLRNCISIFSKPLPMQRSQRPSPLLKLKKPGMMPCVAASSHAAKSVRM